MRVESMHFKERAAVRLRDPRLQKNLEKLTTQFVSRRAAVIKELDDFEGQRDAAVERRDRGIENLSAWIEQFEREASRRGATVLFAETADDASKLVVEIARQHGVKRVIKTKSMVSEEMALNHALEAAGVTPVETDLGEYILQINDNEAPSHIIAPVVHKDKAEISALFARVHKRPALTVIEDMTREARLVLRPKFMAAEMGVTGGNFLIAETGSVAIVTNEGNEGMCTLRPPIHVVVTGIEKVVPTLEDLAVLMRLLPRSATGQTISNYFSLLTGVRGNADADGAQHMYFILVDGGRTGLIGGDFQEMLRCIRCGACMNHCPVYQKIGGHSYGWVYPGPMGSVLTPSYIGLENAIDLPQAATLCGECEVVCPVKIPLPGLMRRLREEQMERGLRPFSERFGLRIWTMVATRPALYAVLTRIAARALSLAAGDKRRLSWLPFGAGWTATRDFPAPNGATFRDRVKQRRRSSPAASMAR